MQGAQGWSAHTPRWARPVLWRQGARRGRACLPPARRGRQTIGAGPSHNKETGLQRCMQSAQGWSAHQLGTPNAVEQGQAGQGAAEPAHPSQRGLADPMCRTQPHCDQLAALHAETPSVLKAASPATGQANAGGAEARWCKCLTPPCQESNPVGWCGGLSHTGWVASWLGGGSDPQVPKAVSPAGEHAAAVEQGQGAAQSLPLHGSMKNNC